MTGPHLPRSAAVERLHEERRRLLDDRETEPVALAAVDASVTGLRMDSGEAVPVTLFDDGSMPLGNVDSPLAPFTERFRPGRLSSSPRAPRADAVWITDSGGESGDESRVVPTEVLG